MYEKTFKDIKNRIEMMKKNIVFKRTVAHTFVDENCN
jgi:hypothetical protein